MTYLKECKENNFHKDFLLNLEIDQEIKQTVVDILGQHNHTC